MPSLESAEHAQQEAADALRSILRDEGEAGQERDALREQLAALRQRAEVLDQLAAADEERRQRLQQALARAGVLAPTFLSDRLQVPDGFEHTIDLYIEAFRDAVLVPFDVQPLAVARALEQDGARAELLYALRPPGAEDGAGGGRGVYHARRQDRFRRRGRREPRREAASRRSRSSAWRRRPIRR